jgi:alpha-amylase/alpha-mannosidase (GH57 family)
VPRSVCIHGHFYQPPRENPWLRAIEWQDGAYPYHDWNERITDECYAQNAVSRVLDDDGRIAHVFNNYARISFNMGPTLLAWMEEHAPDVHEAVVAADRESAERFGGHGSAIAQAYGHVIMPLADARDRRTQVLWGIADFRRRFGREPAGMWLPVTAADTPTLEALAEHGIGFTILAPRQARRVRPLSAAGRGWVDVSDGSVDTTMPYLVRLPSGDEITVFFYDGALSRAVAFEGLLADGEGFAARLRSAPIPDRDGVLVNIATDGESYGHHHRHGDMALAFALHELAADPDVELTNYAAFLERHPPTLEAEIVERSSWSCAHGVERWRADCGCADGGHPDWSQAWRTPLREALDWLRDDVRPRYDEHAGSLLADPWAARDAYVDVLLDPSEKTRQRFLDEQAKPGLDGGDRVTIWKLLELQTNAMLMYTSCGWFFDDLARIETVQVLRYAGRVIELARDVLGSDPEDGFLNRLEEARANDGRDGRAVYDASVRPAVATLDDVAGHYAISSLFEHYGEHARVYCYETRTIRRHEHEAGPARLAVGQARVRSLLTEETTDVEYGVVHLGDHNVDARVRAAGSGTPLDEVYDRLREAFHVADVPETLRRLDAELGPRRYTLDSLFRDEQRRALRTILDASIAEARAVFRNVHRSRAALMRYLDDIGAAIPRVFLRAAEVSVNDDLRRAFRDEDIDAERVQALLLDAQAWGIELDTAGLARELSATIERLIGQATHALEEPTLFDHFAEPQRHFFGRARTIVDLAQSLPFEVDLWRAQNLYDATVRSLRSALESRARAGDPAAVEWSSHLRDLGKALNFAEGRWPTP